MNRPASKYFKFQVCICLRHAEKSDRHTEAFGGNIQGMVFLFFSSIFKSISFSRLILRFNSLISFFWFLIF
jgi:hypothetical protein